MNRPNGRGIIAVANQKLALNDIKAYQKELQIEYFSEENMKEVLLDLRKKVCANQIKDFEKTICCCYYCDIFRDKAEQLDLFQ